MRVLHLTRDLPPAAKGGLGVAVRGLADALLAAGVEVAVVSFDAWRPRARPSHGGSPPAPREEGGARVLRVSTPADLPSAHTFGAAFAPDLCAVHDAMLWEVAAPLAAPPLDVRTVLYLHVLHAEQNRLRGVGERTLSLAAQERALAAADRIVAPSRAARDRLLASTPAAGSRVRVAPLGCVPGPPPTAPRELGLVVYAGRFDVIKGTEELFELIPRIAATSPEARFVVAGGVPGNPKAERRWRRRWEASASPEVRARTTLTGWLDGPDLQRLFRRAQLIVAPSRFETFGLAVLEAMAAGAAPVVTRAGALPELVGHGETGRVVEVGDVAGLAREVVALLADPGTAESLGRRAAAAARAHWTWDRVVADHLAVYTDVE